MEAELKELEVPGGAVRGGGLYRADNIEGGREGGKDRPTKLCQWTERRLVENVLSTSGGLDRLWSRGAAA